MSAARRHDAQSLTGPGRPARREEIYAELVAEIDAIKSLPERYRARMRKEAKLMALLHNARETPTTPTPML